MKHVVIFGHPAEDSFNATIAQTYCDAVRARGHEVVLRDLYRMGFDPCLKAGEIPKPSGFAPAEDIVAERAVIADADVFAFVYPLWFYAPPAIVKGYIDRVFGMGFGYGPSRFGNEALLTDRKMISFTSSGAPEQWIHEEGMWSAIREVFDGHVSRVCGLRVVDHVHFGGIVPNMVKRVVEESTDTVKRVVAKLF